MIIDGVKIHANQELTEEEVRAYLERRDKSKTLTCLDIEVDDDYVNLAFHYTKPFERIRRITGYLTGDIKTWNDAKRHELNDRVKHNT